MNVNNFNTVSNPIGDGSNKENNPRLANALPRPGRRNRPQQQPLASVGYRLSPRIRLTEQHLDFPIHEDETAHDIPQPRREYYGSDLPALADVSNGHKYNYALHHTLYRKYDQLIDVAMRIGDDITRDALIVIKTNYDTVSMLQRVTGLYEWVAGCNPLDVWLWVQDKGYHRRWNEGQKIRFKGFLEWMALVRQARDSNSYPLMIAMDKANSQIIQKKFEGLGLENLTMKKGGLTVLFTPCGEDGYVIYRRDFTEFEQRAIDLLWPEHWAPGQETR